MSPGPVSDSYHNPDFSTQANADEIREAVKIEIDKLTDILGERKYILDVVRDTENIGSNYILSKRQLRIIRWALCEALECI